MAKNKDRFGIFRYEAGMRVRLAMNGLPDPYVISGAVSKSVRMQ